MEKTADESGTATFTGLSSNTTYVVKTTDKNNVTTVVGAVQPSTPPSGSSGSGSSADVSGTGKATDGKALTLTANSDGIHFCVENGYMVSVGKTCSHRQVC